MRSEAPRQSLPNHHSHRYHPSCREYATETVSAEGVFITGGVNSSAIAQRLNQFGAMGWELISSYTISYANGGTHLLVFIYKRPKPEIPAHASPDTPANPFR